MKNQPHLQGNPSYVVYLPYLLAALCFVVFCNTLGHGFVLDDEAVITKNKFVQQGFAGFKDLLTTFYWKGYWETGSGLYRPLSLLIFAIEWTIAPDNPTLYHFVQLFFYILTICVLFKLLEQLLSGINKWLAFCITVLFALHPLHTEVVANVKSLDEILSLFFFILATQQLLKKDQVNWQSCLFLFLALLSKEGAIAFIPVWILMLVQLRKQNWQTAIKKILPLIGVALVWLVIRTAVINQSPSVSYSYQDNSLLACSNWLSQKLTAITILGKSMLHIIWPVGLAYDYSYPQIPCASFSSPGFWVALLVLISLFVAALYYFRKKPILSFGILFFFFTAFLTSNIFLTIGATMADRFMFVPMLGLLLSAGYLAYEKSGNLSLNTAGKTGFALMALACVWGFITFNANTAWKSNERLFSAHVKNVPNSARAQFNYGTTLLNLSIAGVPDSLVKAFEILTLAHNLDPNNVDVQGNLGIANYHLKNYQAAAVWIKKALSYKPNDFMKLNLADTYIKLQQTDSAVVLYKEALTNNIYNGNSHARIGQAYFLANQFLAAAKMFHEGTIAYPENGELWLNYGNALAAGKNYTEAIPALQRALELNPAQRTALYYLAVTYHHLGDDQKANAYMQRYQTGN